jgi:hypothetical protein
MVVDEPIESGGFGSGAFSTSFRLGKTIGDVEGKSVYLTSYAMHV